MEDQTELREALVRALAGRLRPVCMSWPPELFDTMIRKLANITLKYDYHQAMSTHLATAESTKLRRISPPRNSAATQASGSGFGTALSQSSSSASTSHISHPGGTPAKRRFSLPQSKHNHPDAYAGSTYEGTPICPGGVIRPPIVAALDSVG